MSDPWADSPLPPRAWQRACLPVIERSFAERRKGIVSAIMGSGKSVLQAQVVRRVRSTIRQRALLNRVIVVVAPRQKLVEQLSETIAQWNPGEVGTFYAHGKDSIYPIIVACSSSLPQLQVELEGLNRTVSLLIADECHGTESEGFHEVIPKLNPLHRLGFTATPMRSSPKESLSLWDEVIFRYSMDDALRDGVLVPIRVARLEGTEDMPLDEGCLNMIETHGHGPGIVSSYSIDDAVNYAGWLSERGVSALPIHSKMPAATQKRHIELLRTGEVRTLVHVSLLAEGVDFPWLRWICLRREVKASVRFLQEVGRPMRAFPGKTECVVMDPHLLLGRFGLTPAEAIGRALEEAAEAEAQERTPPVRNFEPSDEQAIALERLVLHLFEVREAMVRSKITAVKDIKDNGWTLAAITQAQVEAIKKSKRACRNVPPEHRDSIRKLCSIPWALNRGEASVLLDVLQGSRRWARLEGERLPPTVPDTVKWNLSWPSEAARDVSLPDAQALTAAAALERAKVKHDKKHGGAA